MTNAVDTDNFADARRNASRAVVSLMPSISNNTLPGNTLATQYSTLPLPEPMRTSSGFCVIGIKVWIFKGEVFDKPEAEVQEGEAEGAAPAAGAKPAEAAAPTQS